MLIVFESPAPLPPLPPPPMLPRLLPPPLTPRREYFCDENRCGFIFFAPLRLLMTVSTVFWRKTEPPGRERIDAHEAEDSESMLL